jgi:hypothetical protein
MDPTVDLIQGIKRRYVAGELLKSSVSRQITIGLGERSQPVEDDDIFLIGPDAYLVSDVKTDGAFQTGLLWQLRQRSDADRAK